MKTKNILLMATPAFALPSAKSLLSQNPNLTIITKPDKIRGRGKTPTPSPIKAFAQENKLPVHTPASKAELTTLVQTLNPDLIIVIAFGMILPAEITNHFPCINAHASLLPKYRGPSPINAALLNGDIETGITIIKLTERMDAGPILATKKCPILPEDNFQTLHDKLADLSANVIASEARQSQTEKESPQDETKASYCKLTKKEDLKLNLTQTPQKKLNQIKAYAPKPGAYIEQNKKRIKILAAKIEENKLIPTQVQPEGKPPMTYPDYCRGHKDEIDLNPC